MTTGAQGKDRTVRARPEWRIMGTHVLWGGLLALAGLAVVAAQTLCLFPPPRDVWLVGSLVGLTLGGALVFTRAWADLAGWYSVISSLGVLLGVAHLLPGHTGVVARSWGWSLSGLVFVFVLMMLGAADGADGADASAISFSGGSFDGGSGGGFSGFDFGGGGCH